MRLFLLLPFLLLIFIAGCSNDTDSENYDPDDGYTVTIDTLYIDSFFVKNNEFEENREEVAQFYRDRNFKSAWFKEKKPKPQALALIERLKNAESEGLVMDPYDENRIEKLDQYIEEKRYENEDQLDEKMMETDVALTNLYFDYAKRLNVGSLSPDDFSFGYHIKQKELKLGERLDSILRLENVTDPYSSLEPEHKQYRLLRAYLAEYKGIQESGGWPTVNVEKNLKYGDSSATVVDVRKRLFVNRDIPDSMAYFSRSMRFDSMLVYAVVKFQNRHGLEPTGVVNQETAAAMNMSVEDRIQQIIINMERFRWIPNDLGSPHILVNIPAFTLYVRNEDEEIMDMKVVTGKAVTETVLFSDTMEYLEMSPYWNVPSSITNGEILPKAKRNPGYITSQNMEIVAGNDVISPYSVKWGQYEEGNFPYSIRQKPGKSNALGTIKFIFPNQFNIYLHDTNAKYLFDKTERNFSHGCIRVEKPLELAKFVLRDQPEWTEERIQEHRQKSSPERVYLKNKIPVYVLYFTAWVDTDGTLQFRDDLYNHDSEIKQKLFAQR